MNLIKWLVRYLVDFGKREKAKLTSAVFEHDTYRIARNVQHTIDLSNTRCNILTIKGR